MQTRTVEDLPAFLEPIPLIKPLIYLASPYSAPTMDQRRVRFYAVRGVACKLVAQGHYIYSPIVHNHPLAEDGSAQLNSSWEFWRERDFRMLELCQELWVVNMNGWRESVGVTAEIEHANKLNMPVYLVNRFSLELTVIKNPAVSENLQSLPA